MKADLKGMPSRLLAARRAKGMTLQELSDKSGVSASTISTIECGRSTATVWVMANLCDALGVSMQWMVYGGGK